MSRANFFGGLFTKATANEWLARRNGHRRASLEFGRQMSDVFLRFQVFLGFFGFRKERRPE